MDHNRPITIPFGQILSSPVRNGLSKPKAIRGSGVKMIGMGEIFKYNRIYDIEMDRVPVTHNELELSVLREGDLLFARQSLVLEGAGKCSLVMKMQENTVYESHLIRARINPAIADSRFVYYYFNSYYGKENIKTIVEQVAAAGIRGSDLVKLPIPLPSMETQVTVADILSLLDDKIEHNRLLNHNLEQQAFSIYRHLFVNNADTAWRSGTIADLGNVTGGSTPSKAKSEYYTKNGTAWITPKDLSINKNKFIAHGEIDITELGLKNSSAKIMPKGTVLFSSRAPIGYIAIAKGNVTTNQGFKSVVPNSKIGTAYVYFFLRDNLATIESVASGSTFKEVSGATMKNIEAIIPDDETLTRFSDLCNPIFDQQELLENENANLTAMRDTLLPKLMSGEINVSEVNI